MHRTVPEQRLAEAIFPDAADEQAVWCRADRSPLGTGYMLTIEYDDDNVLPLNRDQLLAYVTTLTDAMMRAQYAEGVRRQLLAAVRGESGRVSPVDERHAIETVQLLREEWPELPEFPPFTIRPCASIEGRTSVQVWRDDQIIVQLAPHNVSEHVVHALRVYAAADLDASYRRYLIGSIGLDPGRATAVVAELAEHHREE